MKKFIIFVLSIFLLLPVGVNAEKAYTKITGNEKILPGANIVYTVILDRQLTKYDAEITYDRSLLNLVSVNEVKLDTVDKKFEVEKGNPIKLSVSSEPSAYIVYTIVMNAKNDIDPQRTSITIKTTTASNGDETFEPDEVDFGIDFVQEDSLFVEEEKPTTTKAKANKILSDIKGIINGNEGIIMWSSLALNLLLIVICFVNIKRKRVDYDF